MFIDKKGLDQFLNNLIIVPVVQHHSLIKQGVTPTLFTMRRKIGAVEFVIVDTSSLRRTFRQRPVWPTYTDFQDNGIL